LGDPAPQKLRKQTLGEAPPAWDWQLVTGFGQSPVVVQA
jgi:hypothetical protein